MSLARPFPRGSVHDTALALNQTQAHYGSCGNEYRPCRIEANAGRLRLGRMSNVNDLAEIAQPLLTAQRGAHIHFNSSADGKRSTQAKASALWTEILQETELLKRLAVLVKSSDYDRPRLPPGVRIPLPPGGLRLSRPRLQPGLVHRGPAIRAAEPRAPARRTARHPARLFA